MHTLSVDKGPGCGVNVKNVNNVNVNNSCVKSFCVTCTCWNVGGWYHRNSNLREAVIHTFNRDIVGIVESHLRFNDKIDISYYTCFGNNRIIENNRAKKGFGSVGFLVCNHLFKNFSVSILNDKVKDCLWLQLTYLTSKDIALFCVCYLPPTTNSRGDYSFEFFNILKQQILQYQSLGHIVICGDFNARCGHTIDIPEANPLSLPVRSICYLNTNSEGFFYTFPRRN